ncbi:MAG: DNA repair protein RadC [Dehalococcoidales bacterium]|nr:DNA repair protein RadC [Dehalococcoidales bacterium]
MKKEAAKDTLEVAGHRDRLREKFRRVGLSGFNDYEIVELLLIFGTPQRDTKQAAKDTLKKFKTVRGVLDAPTEELQKIRGIGPVNAIAVKFIQEIARRYLKDKITEPLAVKSSQEVFEYLYHALSDRKKEIFKVLYLNSQNQILAMEDLFEGTVNCSAVSSREVIDHALKHNAVSLIFVHNHPSGNPEPSQSDKDLTRDLIFAANTVNMKVLDHIIIGNDRYFSFSGAGLIEQGESSFQSLKMKGTSEIKLKSSSSGFTDSGLPWQK